MTVEELLLDVRCSLNDNDILEFTDDELLRYLNSSLDFIENILVVNNSSLLLSSMLLSNSSTVIPNDLLKIEKVENSTGINIPFVAAKRNPTNSYSIIGNTIYSNPANLTLYYYKSFSRYTTKSATINLYSQLIPIIKNYIIIKSLSRLDSDINYEQSELNKLSLMLENLIKDYQGKLYASDTSSVLNFINSVKSTIDTVDKNYHIEDLEILLYLNEGVSFIEKELVNINSSLLIDKIDLLTTETVLPNDFLKVSKLYSKKYNIYLKYSNNDIICDNEYKIYNNKIIVNIVPVVFHYYKKLKRYVLSDNLTIDTFFHQLLFDYAASCCKSKILKNELFKTSCKTDIVRTLENYSYSRDGVMPLKRYNNYWV